MIRLGTDVGGTFTDIVALDETSGKLSFGKTLTTPESPDEGTATGIGKAGIELSAVSLFLHGSTVAINTILERTGALTALLTTEGFRDAYEIGRINRPESYNLFFKKHDPLVERRYRIDVRERTMATGEILVPLDEEQIKRLVQTLRKEGVESIGINFLHSYRNLSHEKRAKEVVAEACPDLYVSASHELSQEYREYERTSTVAANAYIGPRVSSYIHRMETYLERAKFGGAFLIVQSSGGLYNAAQAKLDCIRMLESGPAAGVIGAKAVCSRLGLTSAIAFDMGGTTAKAGVIHEGEVLKTGDTMIGGYLRGLPLQIPMIHIQEVGTGGGSIARVASGGSLRVGPKSAGASPGPVCYGLGGDAPTVTDANLLLGRLAPDRFLGGEMTLDIEAAKTAMQRDIAGPLGLSVAEASHGIIQIAVSQMCHVVKRVTTERGLDGGNFAMIAYGGAGPLHGSFIARELHIPMLIIPPGPGHFSSYGMLVADLQRDFVQTWFSPLASVDFERIEAIYEDMESKGKAEIGEAIRGTETVLNRAADMRYVGQEHAVTVDLSLDLFKRQDIAGIKKRFDAVHERRYGYCTERSPCEIVSLRSSVTGVLVKPRGEAVAVGTADPKQAYIDSRPVCFTPEQGFVTTPVYSRPRLQAKNRISGPALIEEHASTTVVCPGDELEVNSFGDLVITIGRD